MKRWLIACVALLLLFIALIFGVDRYVQSRDATGYQPMPVVEHQDKFNSDENGYHQIEQAAAQLFNPEKDVYEELDAMRVSSSVTPSARKYIEDNQNIIEAALKGLEHEYVMMPPFVAGEERPWLESSRRLARLLNFDGHLHRVEGDMDTALVRFIDILYLGHWTSNGGVLIDAMVGNALQRLALDSIYDQVDSLNQVQLASLIDQLNELDSIRIPIEQVFVTEEAIAAMHGNVVTRIIGRRITKPALERAAAAYHRSHTRFVGTALRARVRIYELDTGQSPSSLVDPLYDIQVPIDPVTENPFQLVNGKIFSPGLRIDAFQVTEDSPIDGKVVF